MIHLDEQLIIDYAHGALEPQVDADVFAHIGECDPCARAHRDEVALIEILRGKAGAEERDFPASLRANILAAAVAPRRADFLTSARESFARLRTRAAFGAAAGVAAVLAVVAFTPHGAGAPTSPVVARVDPGVGRMTAAAFIARHDAATSDMPLADHYGAPTIETASYAGDDADVSTE